MRTRTRRALLVLTAAGLVATVGGPVTGATAAGTCEPATRVIEADDGSWPKALSPEGHVVTSLYVSGTATYRETLHAPDGSTNDIADGDVVPWGAVDVNGRGVVAGTQRPPTAAGPSIYQPWVFRHGTVRLLKNPGKVGYNVRKDYYVSAVNSRSAVIGLKTNAGRFSPSDPEYVSRPVLWPTPGSTPIKLDMPRGFSVPYLSTRLLDVFTDGTITGVLVDEDGRYHLAVWVTPGADPDLRRIRETWRPVDLAGQWVVGNVAGLRDKVFIRSWTESFVVDGPEPIFATAVSSNGTFTVASADQTQTPTAFVGRGTDAVREIGHGVGVTDLASTASGQVLVHRDQSSIEVVTCALGLPEASAFEVTQLSPTKEKP